MVSWWKKWAALRLMLLDAFVELIEQGSVHDSQPRALGIRRKVALVEQLLKSIASDERLQSVQITMLADHHLRVIPLALQQRRETSARMTFWASV